VILNKFIKRLLITAAALFIVMNVVAYFHASKFTHFNPASKPKTKDAAHLSVTEKVKAVFLGVNNPRPTNKKTPIHNFETIKLKSNKEIECWYLKADSSIGTVILFHGYSGQKSSMLDKADVFLSLGYNTLLVDFMGSGGSEGNQTTIGFFEAQEVQTAFEYLVTKGDTNISLFGTSMGAVAIMKAQSEYDLHTTSIIIECPFGTMLETVQSRFSTMHVPSFPMANLLVFWGGYQNDFDAFSHNPVDYAKNIKCPTLLLYGEKDEKVSRGEIDAIFKNLNGRKELILYPLARHENYLNKYKTEWTKDVNTFLSSVN
jgi:alpha-beta hydrolase superfamily lysophospholipase